MKVSVALATYNGEQFLKPQIDSIINQTRLPDELVISDDNSSDNTLKILSFSLNRAPFDVKISKNIHNIGFSRNFEKTLSLCSGDIIFICDQDDVWFPEKVEFIENIFRKYDTCKVVISNAEIMNRDGLPLGFTILERIKQLGLKEEDFVTGCCMAIRRDFLPLVLPIPHEIFTYDSWITQLSSCLGVRFLIPIVLQYYRRHDRNTSSWLITAPYKVSKRRLFLAYLDENTLQFTLLRYSRLSALKTRLQHIKEAKMFSDESILQNCLKSIERELDATSKRIQILKQPRSRRLLSVIRFYLHGNYSFFSGWKSAVKDLLK